jgi:bifunctional DNA-binding transcriptional regulator/antitoxin component of YhaV-PrlF toxin-antitoxin module
VIQGSISLGAIKLTSKRQATLPRRLCEEMNLKPGDSIEVQPYAVEGERVWLLRPRPHEVRETPEWYGCLRRYAQGKPHDMQSVRKSIEKARGNEPH